MFTDEQKQLLAAPLSRRDVYQRQGFSYIKGWHAIAEANRIFGFDGWTRETVLMEQTNCDLVELSDRGRKYQQWRVGYMAKVKIAAGGAVREGVGFGIGIANPESLSNAIESACKEAETDAMKRALMTFGNPFGLALYDETQQNVVDADPLEDPEQCKAAIAESMRKASIPKDSMAGVFKQWLEDVGVSDIKETTVGQRKAFIEQIQTGQPAQQKGE